MKSILLAMLTAMPAAPVPGLQIDRSFGSSQVWDDGMAEVAQYESHRMVYGIDRAFQTTLITVKEEFDARSGVKADVPYTERPIVTVLKLNILSVIPTENYSYSYMTSVFVRRDDPRVLVKAAVSSQEWCGTTFKEVVTWDGPPRLQFHSYFDKQADGIYPIALDSGTLLEDQLLLTVRAVESAPGVAVPLALHGSLISNSVPKAPVSRALTMVNAGAEPVVTPAGRFETTRYDVRDEGVPERPVLSYWIENGGNRVLVRFSAADGRSMILKEISRRDYWSRKQP